MMITPHVPCAAPLRMRVISSAAMMYAPRKEVAVRGMMRGARGVFITPQAVIARVQEACVIAEAPFSVRARYCRCAGAARVQRRASAMRMICKIFGHADSRDVISHLSAEILRCAYYARVPTTTNKRKPAAKTTVIAIAFRFTCRSFYRVSARALIMLCHLFFFSPMPLF